ncbi:GntR family transcriptional regulator [Halalkalibacter okhensis]|uniref:HTH gntR-type domain-containing protein n=1 Tax=Halalkalibacter okhensis TaxID=333138 RepID=A0A0B0IL98_9BACI|nr:GntR family transcriptional regulator [Halalkalibacter okhensis]KHF41672.1 hypothetical protein LQ50_02940 [Halalkalibacter okhensis]
MKINKDSPLPLYYQVKELLKKEIHINKIKVGEMIPSERELSDMFDISRPTVRQAINDLVNEGVLKRKKGLGTFVSQPKINQRFLENLTSFKDEMEEKGLPNSTKLLDIKDVDCNDHINKIFHEKYNKFVYIERLRYVKKSPVVIVSTYIPKELAPDLLKEDLTNFSLYEILQKTYHLNIKNAKRIMEAINASSQEAIWLNIEPNAAVMLIKTIAYLDNQMPFEYTIARYRGDFSSFTVNTSI